MFLIYKYIYQFQTKCKYLSQTILQFGSEVSINNLIPEVEVNTTSGTSFIFPDVHVILRRKTRYINSKLCVEVGSNTTNSSKVCIQ